MYSMSVAVLGTQLRSLLQISSLSSRSNEVRMLQHFQSVTSRSIGSPTLKRLLYGNVSKRAWDHPYLMHMTLAVSAAHLKRLRADVPTTHDAVSEAQHWQQGLLLHRKELAEPPHEYDTRYDARVETTFLTIIYLCALDDRLPLDAFLNGSEETLLHAISPMAACNGFRALRINAGPLTHSSVWLPVLTATDDAQRSFSNEAPGPDGLPAAFVELCGIGADSTVDNNDYHRIVRYLTPLLRLKPDVSNFAKLFSFAGRSWLNFKPLLLRRDHRALLLMSYWFGLLHQIDQWWLTVRAQSECAALVAYLSESSDDPRLRRLLEYPSSFGQSGLSAIWHLSNESAT